MATVVQWGERVGVPVNEQKTVHMMLKGMLSANRPPTIRCGNVSIARVGKVKYLGVTLQPNMLFRGHFEAIADKVGKLATSLRRVTRKEWGLTRKTALVLYRGLFVPVMGYASLLWADSTRRESERAILLRAQRSALYVVLPFCTTVSLSAMQVIAGQLPWDLEAQRLAEMAKLRKGMVLLPTDLAYQVRLEGLTLRQRAEFVKELYYDEWQRR